MDYNFRNHQVHFHSVLDQANEYCQLILIRPFDVQTLVLLT